MYLVSDEEFEEIVRNSIDGIPEEYASKISNLAFVVEDQPTEEQSKRLKLHPGTTLFGLYEGIPLTQRGSNYNLVLPDKITIFKRPIEHSSQTLQDVVKRVKNTVWHEVAHYYGLDHDRIHELEKGS